MCAGSRCVDGVDRGQGRVHAADTCVFGGDRTGGQAVRSPGDGSACGADIGPEPAEAWIRPDTAQLDDDATQMVDDIGLMWTLMRDGAVHTQRWVQLVQFGDRVLESVQRARLASEDIAEDGQRVGRAAAQDVPRMRAIEPRLPGANVPATRVARQVPPVAPSARSTPLCSASPRPRAPLQTMNAVSTTQDQRAGRCGRRASGTR